MSSPPSRTVPVSGCSKPAMMRSVVVLPDPEGPSSVKNSPWPIVRSTVATATTSAYVLRMPASATSAGKGRLEDVEPAVELVVRDRRRRQQPDDVAGDAAREQDEPALACRVRDAVGLLAGPLAQLDCEHGAEAAHVGALWCDLLEPRADLGAELVRASAQLRQLVEYGERRGA